ncbi:hypothetical protein Rleg4DRAFT_4823 [Rhizobium leguminosarum bv. trifolii WSM2297]|uniref:Uncharacterized protein n=1 Tax=Rhizobium leguminosarum bv. trifolii WSM2297 TaxID=754762 RepID=J0WCX9_RHILT|nr:hypothetical protein [Rhizobium leguminosarum]EJC83083.1 hypothetical protein Rleg4DRAFT_4823 [Rhizobium leguminosarum bv. trifolii WSM2297]
MSKNDVQPRLAPSILPERLRNDGWWLSQEFQDAPDVPTLGSRLIVIETQHLQEEQQ